MLHAKRGRAIAAASEGANAVRSLVEEVHGRQWQADRQGSKSWWQCPGRPAISSAAGAEPVLPKQVVVDDTVIRCEASPSRLQEQARAKGRGKGHEPIRPPIYDARIAKELQTCMEERRARQKLTQALSIDCMETCWTEGYSRAHGWGVVRGGSAPGDVMAAPISEHAVEFSDQFEFGTDADFGWTEERKMKEKQDKKDKKDMTEADERLPTTSKLAWGSRTSRRGAYFFRTSRCQGVGDCGLHPHPMDLQDRANETGPRVPGRDQRYLR